MSILIEGMEMPTRCADCRLSTVHSFNDRPLCDVLVEYMSYGEWEAKRLDHCPLVPVPPHGRLIDADAVTLEGGPYEYDDWCKWALEQYQNAPTIIPASWEGEA